MALSISAQGIMIRKPTVHHADAGLDFYASKTLGKDEVVKYYYDPLVFANLTEEQHKKKIHEEASCR